MIQIQREKAPAIATSAIEHLIACHRRIEQRLGVLELAGSLLDEQPAKCLLAITNSLRFMDTAGVLHTADEEESVFPRVRSCVPANEAAYLDQLEAEHKEADGIYLQLKTVVAKLAEAATPELVVEYRGLAKQLADLYRRHMASEETVLVDIGRRVLTADQLETIHSEMQARRR